MDKKGGQNTTLYVIIILIVTVLLIYILYKILQTKVGGLFAGI